MIMNLKTVMRVDIIDVQTQKLVDTLQNQYLRVNLPIEFSEQPAQTTQGFRFPLRSSTTPTIPPSHHHLGPFRPRSLSVSEETVLV
jgi:hypothetical protein